MNTKGYSGDLMRHERLLYKPLIRFLKRSKGFCVIKEEVLVYPEMRSYRKSVDLVVTNKTKTRLVAIEVKISNWKVALRQAFINSCFVHCSYVALWHKSVKRVNKQIFKKYGVGLLSVNKSTVEEVVRPKTFNPSSTINL